MISVSRRQRKPLRSAERIRPTTNTSQSKSRLCVCACNRASHLPMQQKFHNGVRVVVVN